jgi:Skp family chaperone for outer membrane proteins
MTNKNLLQEAIAEAKTIRQAAITNAKEALEESLTPHLKEMLAKKLQEMDEADNEEVVDENINNTEDEHELVNNVNEAEDAEDDVPAEDEEAPEDDMPVDDMPEEEEELDFENMTRDDFKNLLTDLMGEIEAEKAEEMPGEENPDDNAIDIDEPSTEDDEINIDELLAELAGEEEVKEDLNEAKKKAAKEKEAKEKELAAKKKESKELKEALDTVNILRTQLQEVNLLNAKLLYVNKVFKSNNLTEGQKVNVIAAFDKAETVKEVKLVFETVSKNVVAKKPSTIKEHTSFASKPTGTTASAPKEIINEVSDQVLRMQKLAGIIK